MWYFNGVIYKNLIGRIIMKRLTTYFITICLLLGCGGNVNLVSAKATITKLYQDSFLGIYNQVVGGHYYYMRQTGKYYRYTVYRNAGKK